MFQGVVTTPRRKTYPDRLPHISGTFVQELTNLWGCVPFQEDV